MSENHPDQSARPDKGHSSEAEPKSILQQPVAVWALAFACAVSFMGIGLVDPILPAISRELDATPTQTMLLFTSYLLITAVAMFFSAFISSRIGVKRTLLIGLALIVVFAFLSGAAGSVDAIIGFRAGWGLGNALFISTALSAIVGAAAGGSGQAVILYEAAMGIGMAVGPLAGGLLGEISWRAPLLRHCRADGSRLHRDLRAAARPGEEAGSSFFLRRGSPRSRIRRCSRSAWSPSSTTTASSPCSRTRLTPSMKRRPPPDASSALSSSASSSSAGACASPCPRSFSRPA